MEQKSKKISIFQVVIFLISFVAAYFAVDYFLSKSDKTLNAMLVENSRTANRSMPKMLDAETRLDSTAVDNTTLKYYHTLINTDKDSSAFDFNAIKTTMAKKAQDNLETNPIMEEYKENNIYLQYIFNDKNQKEIFEYTVRHQKQN